LFPKETLMSVAGPFVHHIDPIIGTVFGVHLWWYGLSYTLGFLNAHLFMMRRRNQLGLSVRAVYDLSILLAVGVLRGRAPSADAADATLASVAVGWRRTVFAVLLVFSLVQPSDWTQDVPARYRKRHQGLTNSAMYPKIDSSPPQSPAEIRPPETPGQIIRRPN
jgi:hypothetical protein